MLMYVLAGVEVEEEKACDHVGWKTARPGHEVERPRGEGRFCDLRLFEQSCLEQAAIQLSIYSRIWDAAAWLNKF